MKINQIPELYLEQYLLGELPENLSKELDELILKNPLLKKRISELKKSNEDILSAYTVESMMPLISEKSGLRRTTQSDTGNEFKRQSDGNKSSHGIAAAFTGSVKKIADVISLISSRRYALSIASAAALLIIIVFMTPGIKNTFNTGAVIDNDVRIKGLDSKLLLYRVKGKNIEELKNFDTACKGDVIQLGYIATGDYRFGIIISIDGRGVVTRHLPDDMKTGAQLVKNKRTLLNRSYELDDSPSFEKFIMILSTDPINISEVTEKAKKLAINSTNAVNGLIESGKNSVEYSIIIKKTE